jgi:septum formation topological specificity factor MinE
MAARAKKKRMLGAYVVIVLAIRTLMTAASAEDSPGVKGFCRAFASICRDPNFKAGVVSPFVDSFDYFANLSGFNPDYFWRNLASEQAGYLFFNLKSIVKTGPESEELAAEFGKWTANYIAESLPIGTSRTVLKQRAASMADIMGELRREDVEVIGRYFGIGSLWSEQSKNEIEGLLKVLKVMRDLEVQLTPHKFNSFLRSLKHEDFQRIAAHSKQKDFESILTAWGNEYVEHLVQSRNCKNLLTSEARASE